MDAEAQSVVITSMGAVTPLGCGVDAYWSALAAGECGIEALTRLDEATLERLPVRIAGEVEAIQTETERRTYAIGYELELLTDKLAAAVESGDYTDQELEDIRALARSAQFYWDFVFVENSEGAHNSALARECLDKSEAILNEAMALLH